MIVKGIIFDLFGTLVKIEKRYHPFYDIVRASKFSRREKKQFQKLAMTSEFESVSHLFEEMKLRPNIETGHIEEKLNLETQTIAPFEETRSVLENLSKKYDLFLLSNLAGWYKDAFLLNFDLDQYFKKMFFSCEIGKIKPNIDLYQKVIQDSGLKKTELIMIGDNINDDYKGAQNAGLEALFLDRYNSKSVPLKNSIANLQEIERKISGL